MQLKNLISVSTLSSILKNGGFNQKGYRLLDCTSTTVPKHGYKVFKKDMYGNFEAMIGLETQARKDYLKAHIPEAIHMDLAVATYPGRYQAYAMYPPELFQNYMRLLGINHGDQIVLYGRDALHGMLYTCAAAWMLKTYGHERIAVLDGGLAQWKKHDGEVTSKVPQLKRGDWKASMNMQKVITYDELTERDQAGHDLFDKIGSLNWLDTRTKGQFTGAEPTNLDPQTVKGSYIPGSRSAPAVDLFVNGVLKPVDELRKWLSECGYERGKPIITSCNRGMQAAVVALALEHADPTLKPRVYSASFEELEERNPKKISAGKNYVA